jgi:quercetin dioxygenase-like cupin family protein
MIRTGDTIHNPVTGERITFHATSADTTGEAVAIECTVQPDGFVAATHLHPSQCERFAVIDGTLGLKNGKEKVTLERGEVAVVEPGTPHRFWNAAAAAGVVAEGGSGDRRSGGPGPGLPPDVRAGGRLLRNPRNLMRKKHFYFMLLVLALILLALPGFAAKAAKRVTGPALRFA